MRKNFIFTSLATLMLFACGEETTRVEPIQKQDKQLSCQELLFEVNDSKFYIKQAQEKKSLGIKSIVMPLGYIDTYMTADEAIAAANQRISYLERIYEIRDCEAQRDIQSSAPINNNAIQQRTPQQQQAQPKTQYYY